MDARGVPGVGTPRCPRARLPGRACRYRPDGRRRWRADPDGCVHPMTISIPKLSLVVLIGASGSGKSTFARAQFKGTEIISSDACRGLVSDDENDQTATGDAFD